MKIIDFLKNFVKFNRNSLSTKASLVLTIFLATAVITLGSISIKSTEEFKERALQAMEVLANATASHLDTVLNSFDRTVRGIRAEIAQAITNNGSELSCHETYLSQIEVFTKHVVILGENGQVLLSCPTEGEGIEGLDLSDFVDGLPSNELGTLPVYYLDKPDNPVVAIYELEDESGETIGRLAAILDLRAEGFNVFGPTQDLGISGHMEIIAESGLVIEASETNHGFGHRVHDDLITDMIAEGRTQTSMCHSCHESYVGEMRENEVMAFAPISMAPWGVAVHQLESEVFNAENTARESISILAIGATGAIIALGYFTYRYVTEPLRHLAGMANQYAGGNLEEELVTTRSDEIGILSAALNRMRQQLRSMIEEISSSNVKLDVKVRHATEDLRRARDEIDQSNKTLQAVMDGLEDRILVIGQDMTIQMTNQSARRAWANPSTGVGGPCWEVAHSGNPCSSMGCPCPVERVFKTGNAFSYVHKHNYGSYPARYLRYSAFPLHKNAGEVDQVIEQIRDVTHEFRERRQRKLLLKNIISAQEEERQRLGRDLDDETGQALLAIMIQCASLSQQTKTTDWQLSRELNDLRAYSASTLKSLRTLIQQLRPEALDELGLVQAIKSLVNEQLPHKHYQTDSQFIGLEQRLDAQVEITAYRIIQESVNNIVRHAKASKVVIRMRRDQQWLNIIISDEGRGFNLSVEERTEGETHWGLKFMRERAEMHGGTLSVSSVENEGTTISARIPLEVFP
jgi:signal transduction histidine kinase